MIGTLAEGVRSVVVDRNHRPRWQPATLEEVTPEYIEGYFLSLGEDELEV